MRELKRVFMENNYKIVHAELTTMSMFSLAVASKCKVPVRICHGHNTASKGETKKNILKYALRPFAKVNANYLFACSQYAGNWLYGNSSIKSSTVKVVRNAIDIERFRFNNEARRQVRSDLKIDDKFVIGHIGRFVYQKNHDFLIDIFYYVHKMNPDAVLLLIGDGPLENEIRKKVIAKNLNDAVIFLGVHQDIEKYYSAFDVFTLPSHYEGLPVVGVESQASGLPCVFSDAMTKETKILDSTKMLRLSLSAEDWAKCILAQLPLSNRQLCADIIRTKGFDISSEAKKLQEFYLNLERSN